MSTRQELLSRLRSIQLSSELREAPSKPVRFVLEFGTVPDAAAVETDIRTRLGLQTTAARLSRSHGLDVPSQDDGLSNFLAVTLSGISVADLWPAPFEAGYALADATGAVSAEPELGTCFFGEPRPAETESIDDFPPGCWVDQAEDPTSREPMWAVNALRAPAAWELVPPAGGKRMGEGVKIFQPDTGVATHVELGDGMLDTSVAFDFIRNVPGATDPMNYSGNPGHGTGTASVVAGRGKSGRMSGAAPAATLVPLRAIEAVIVFDHGRVAAAVDYARRKGADVITMSLGGAWSSALRAAIDRAIQDGVIVLAAAGNCVDLVVWPARYEEVIAVGGYNKHDKPWKGSCHGAEVDVSAPAEFVPRANRSPSNGGDERAVSGGQGTSFAVALTAGVAALWLAHHGKARIRTSLKRGQTIQDKFASFLAATARRPAGWPDDEYGKGLVDAARLLAHPLEEREDARELVAESAVPNASLHSMLSERLAATGGGQHESVGGFEIDHRFAAEISHLALEQACGKSRAMTESPVEQTLPSETLLKAMAATPMGPVIDSLSSRS